MNIFCFKTYKTLLKKFFTRCNKLDMFVCEKEQHTTKHQSNSIQQGRSMVEMIGVLAIIGVLSVGAISGYASAMNKHKLNKLTQQYNTLIAAVGKYHGSLNNFKETDVKTGNGVSLIPYLKVLNEIPVEMIRPNTNAAIYDIYKNSIDIYRHDTGYTGMIVNIVKSSNGIETCEKLTQISIPFADELYSLMFRVSHEANYTSYYGKGCQKNQKCLKDLNLSSIHDLCKTCEESLNSCTFLLMFK